LTLRKNQERYLGASTNPEPGHAAKTPRQIHKPIPTGLGRQTDQAIAASGGNVRDAVKTLIIANEFLEVEVSQAAISNGYARGKFEPAPRDRKDWYNW